MPLLAAVCFVAFATPKATWNQILEQSPVAVNKRLGKPIRSEVEAYTVYDPREIIWAEQLNQGGVAVGRTLTISWLYNERAMHDIDLMANRIPKHAQATGNWVAYIGGPLSDFEKIAGKPTREDSSTGFGMQMRANRYKVKNLGEAEIEAWEFKKGKPVVTRITVFLRSQWTFENVLKTMKIKGSAWRTMGRDYDPNSVAHLRYALGKGTWRENEYSLGADGSLKVLFAGLAGKETAQQFTLFSEKLTGLRQGASWFGYTIPPNEIHSMQGTESAWDRLHYMAVYTPQPKKQLTIGIWGFDVNDLN